MFGKLDDISLGVEEQKGLGGADGKAGVCALAAAGDLGANLVLQDLGARSETVNSALRGGGLGLPRRRRCTRRTAPRCSSWPSRHDRNSLPSTISPV